MKKKLCGLGIMWIVLSCNEKSVNSGFNQNEEIQVFQNTLVFQNEEVLKNSIKVLKKKFNDKTLISFESEHKGYVSMRKAYSDLSDGDKEKIGKSKSVKGYEKYLKIIETDLGQEIITQISDPILSALFNKDGVLIVGNSAYKINNGNVFEAKNFKFNMSLEKIAFKKTGEITEIRDIEINNLNEISKSPNKARLYPQHGCHDVYDGDRAYTADFSMTIASNWTYIHFLNFEDLHWNVKHKKRSWGFWWTNEAPTLMSKGTLSIPSQITGTQQYHNLNQSCTNCSELNGYIYFGEAHIVGVSLTSEGIGDDDNFHSCNAFHDY